MGRGEKKETTITLNLARTRWFLDNWKRVFKLFPGINYYSKVRGRNGDYL